ncbi:hypothetical protein, partial [Microcoleus sp. Pol12B4]|uniref:hypothetical protein n=1 Tax=Microcoleus sp. Pol12B4 TaxID=3055395 RepID=UPI003B0579B3
DFKSSKSSFSLVLWYSGCLKTVRSIDIKEQLKWLRFEQIEELRAAVQKELNKLTNEVIASLTGWQFILEAISVAEH